MASSSSINIKSEKQTTEEACEADGVKTPASDKSFDEFARQQFYKNRKVIIQNVPRVTYNEVKEYMGRFAVADIAISRRLKHAIVTLKHGVEAEAAVSDLSGVPLLSVDVQISLYRGGDNLLCVTALPASLCTDDAAFRTFVEAFGPVEKCFLMRYASGCFEMYDNYGGCKGYGFVEYSHNREKSDLARRQLEGMKVSGSVLRCQFVPASLVRFTDLQSRCLLVTNIPPDVSTTATLCHMFSVTAAPAFCQLSGGADWTTSFAVVEYSSAGEAELTAVSVAASQSMLEMQFCCPGETGTDVFNRLLAAKNQTLPSISETPSLITHPPMIVQPLHTHSTTTSSAWTIPPIVPPVVPLVPLLPPPIVIAPIEPAAVPPPTQPISLLSQPEPTNGYVAAPAVAMATESRGRVLRPITGRGSRDQLQATINADTVREAQREMPPRVLKVIQPTQTTDAVSRYPVIADVNCSWHSTNTTLSSHFSAKKNPAVSGSDLATASSTGQSTRRNSSSAVPSIHPAIHTAGHMTVLDNVIGCRTPVAGSKRSHSRPHFVASPEPSPEGPYVGQHSQGIGGHYAESYLTKRRRKL